MKNIKLLSIDESGKASYAHLSRLFILSAVVIRENDKPRLDREIRQLKRKYFKSEEIVFHSRDMSRRKGPFALLRDPKIEFSFWSQFISIAKSPQINLIFVVVDKAKTKSMGWVPKTILKRAYLKLLEVFAKSIGNNCHGRIITESDPQQDLFLIQAHNRIQSQGTTDRKLSAQEYSKRITSLSLVNKSNLDADVQLADSFAPIAGMMYELKSQKKSVYVMSSSDQMKEKLITMKLADKSNGSKFIVLV